MFFFVSAQEVTTTFTLALMRSTLDGHDVPATKIVKYFRLTIYEIKMRNTNQVSLRRVNIKLLFYERFSIIFENSVVDLLVIS